MDNCWLWPPRRTCRHLGLMTISQQTPHQRRQSPTEQLTCITAIWQSSNVRVIFLPEWLTNVIYHTAAKHWCHACTNITAHLKHQHSIYRNLLSQILDKALLLPVTLPAVSVYSVYIPCTSEPKPINQGKHLGIVLQAICPYYCQSNNSKAMKASKTLLYYKQLWVDRNVSA